MARTHGKSAMLETAYQTLTETSAKASAVATTAELDALRAGAAADRKGRIRRAKFFAAVLALRLQGFSMQDSAEILGCSKARIRFALEACRQDATIDSQLDRLDKIAVPCAVDNVVTGVQNGDKEYTLKVLDGRGVFRTHRSIDAHVKRTTLELKVITVTAVPPPGQSLPVSRPGSAVGAPVGLLTAVEDHDALR